MCESIDSSVPLYPSSAPKRVVDMLYKNCTEMAYITSLS